MILQALTTHYEALAARGEIARPGYAPAKVGFSLCIGWDGVLQGILPLTVEVQRGKKMAMVARTMTVPEPQIRTVKVISNFLCDNATYLLGIDSKGKPERALQCFEASAQLHQAILKEVSSPGAQAVKAFFGSWKPEEALNHPLIQPVLMALMAGGNLVFGLPEGPPPHDDVAIRSAWESHYLGAQGCTRMQCLVTGKDEEPIAVLHGKIKGVRGAQSVGASLVSFNARAYESFARDEQQGLNAPISEYAAFAYVSALNHLLGQEKHRQFLGDMTIVYWAEDANPAYADKVDLFLAPPDDQTTLHSIMGKMALGQPIDDSNLDWRMPFYVLGLSPNAARVAVRFFWRSSFGKMLENLKAHYDRLEIVRGRYDIEFISITALIRETLKPSEVKNRNAAEREDAETKKKDVIAVFSAALLRAILTGTPYPEALISRLMERIRGEQQITRAKAAMIKAWLLLNKKASHQEVLKVRLNENGDYKPYVLGRLLAVLEELQWYAIWGGKERYEDESTKQVSSRGKSTITKRYLASACVTPLYVFSNLMRLASHHAAKLDNGVYYIKTISELMGKLSKEDPPFPKLLNKEEQGYFILGYYQQKQVAFTKNMEG